MPNDYMPEEIQEIEDLQNFAKGDGESNWDLRRPKTFHQLDMEKMGIDIKP